MCRVAVIECLANVGGVGKEKTPWQPLRAFAAFGHSLYCDAVLLFLDRMLLHTVTCPHGRHGASMANISLN